MRWPLGRRCVVWGCAVFLLFAGSVSDVGAMRAALSGSADAEVAAPEDQEAVRTVADRGRKRASGGDWGQMQRRFQGAFVLSAPRETRKVALTFDDVPDARYTYQVLNVLKQYRVHATFFVVGSRVRGNPAIVRRMHRDGHAIGNHSYNHPAFSRLKLSDMKDQIARTEAAVRDTVGFAPRFIRPPYGEITSRQMAWARANGYTVVNWDVDSLDWRQLKAQTVLNNVTKSVKPGSIILLHAGGGKGQNLHGTVEALPKLIKWLRSNGYEPVTIPELLGQSESRRS
ncbi:polysaccharide deacetylase family protein [Cohnella zeiphila]|uniref:Polysaccharide deacetylase family protein n=1 Tax=Cohnella zeiphila TaxID=2761120 RepID=A0A7X0VW27_9BACL|nr:polysaccharide deacetylase family protein [Cohnella zeiphila]MBB6732516.1 polysaccharide deacetylase family protein [Cohnella zeiphila]